MNKRGCMAYRYTSVGFVLENLTQLGSVDLTGEKNQVILKLNIDTDKYVCSLMPKKCNAIMLSGLECYRRVAGIELPHMCYDADWVRRQRKNSGTNV